MEGDPIDDESRELLDERNDLDSELRAAIERSLEQSGTNDETDSQSLFLFIASAMSPSNEECGEAIKSMILAFATIK